MGGPPPQPLTRSTSHHDELDEGGEAVVAPPMLLGRALSLQEAREQADGELPVGCVVKIHSTGVEPNYTSPWRVKEQQSWTGSGFCISGRRIITNAHVVENATLLQVQAQDQPKKWRCHTTSIAHDLDLAIVAVDDESFWATAMTVLLAPPDYVPNLYSEVNAIGFPAGGSTVCVTKGVVSRYDAHVYVHPATMGIDSWSANSSGNVYILQVDAAINSGNSGGPCVDKKGQVVGVSSSNRPNAQNVGYIIPIAVVHLFLDEVSERGSWSGVSEFGLTLRCIESDAYRSYIGMPVDKTGLLVDKVAPLGQVHGHVSPGDILTHIDGFEVSNEGKVPVNVGGQRVWITYDALVTSKPKGELTTLTLLREVENKAKKGPERARRGKRVEDEDEDEDEDDGDGNEEGEDEAEADGTKGDEPRQVEEAIISVELAPIPPLAARYHGVDAVPEFVAIAGLVFSRLSVPLMQENGYNSKRLYIDRQYANEYKKSSTHEKVICVSILKHDVNIGCAGAGCLVDTVDGVKIKSLAQLASIAAAIESNVCSSGAESHHGSFVRIKFKAPRGAPKDTHSLPDIVLDRAKIAAANLEICQTHAMSGSLSQSLLVEESPVGSS